MTTCSALSQNILPRIWNESGPLAFILQSSGSGKPSVGEERGTVPELKNAEVTQYLLQQKDPLLVFGQVVCCEAALDASPDHNGIIEMVLSCHGALPITRSHHRACMHIRQTMADSGVEGEE